MLCSLALLLMACTPDDNPDPAATQAPPAAPSPQVMLRAPLDDANVYSLQDMRALAWAYEPDLADNHYFDVRLWPEGDIAQGLTWTKDTAFDLSEWLLFAEPDVYNWSVAVIEGRVENGVGELVQEIVSSPVYRFTVHDVDTQSTERFMSLPPGFEGHVYAFGPTEPTVITEGPDGHLYIAGLFGDIFRAIDADGDGYAETVELVYQGMGTLQFLTGMVFGADGTVYVSDSGRIGTLSDTDADGVYDTHTVLVDDIPAWQYWAHANSGLAFGPDGKLYVGVGATTDHGPIQADLEASILRMNPDGSALEVFATGFRNPYDIAFTPEGDLFAIDNNPDQFPPSLPYLPAEELNHVRAGLNYGFPDVFSPPLNGYGDTEPPAALFLASVGSAGITHYRHAAFPEPYNDGLFVAQWGGNGYLEDLPNGFRVVFVALEPTDDGTFVGEWVSFAAFEPGASFSRPVDVTVGRDGALYVAEHQSGVILRIVYTGDIETVSAEAQLVAQGDALYNGAIAGAPSCSSCHNNSAIAPLLTNIAAIAETRNPAQDAATYLRESITMPNAYIVEGYNAGAMYADYAAVLTDGEIDALVAYMQTLQE